MKKRSLMLLMTSFAGLALAGGTFAAWAVTDNAPEVSVKVSPGTVTTDDTSYVTLEWGASQELNNVSQLQAGETRKVGVLDLRANTQSTDAFNGELTKTITYTGETTDYKLSTILEIKVYAGDIDEPTGSPIAFTNGVYTVVTTADHFENEQLVEGNRNRPIKFSVFASLPNMTASVYGHYKDQTATVKFDWGKAANTETVTTTYTTYYASGFGSTVYAYAWKSGGENAPFPGVKMEAAKVNGYYSILLDDAKAWEKIIFSDGTEAKKSGDIVIATSFVEGKNCFTYNSTVETVHGTFSEHDDTVQPAYYLVGKNLTIGSRTYTEDTGWAPYEEGLITLNNNGVGSIAGIKTTGNAELKIYEVASKTWYSNDGNNFKLNDSGIYTITFDLNDNQPISAVRTGDYTA